MASPESIPTEDGNVEGVTGESVLTLGCLHVNKCIIIIYFWFE